MTLFPVQAHERTPVGLFPLASGVSVEGGMVGRVVDDGVNDLPEVVLYDGSTDAASPFGSNLIGLIDDSTSAVQGRGVTGIGVSIGVGITPETGSPTGPATHLASRKVTLWLDHGLYATDVWDTTDSVLGTDLTGVAPGTNLSVDPGGTDGLLQVDVNAQELAKFVRRFVGGQDAVDDFESFFIPRVQPLPEGRVFMLLRFKN